MLPRTLDTQAVFPPTDFATWRAAAEAELDGATFERKLITHTYEGLLVRPLYTPADWPTDGASDSGRTGSPPWTRGGMPLTSTRFGWDIRQERGEPAPDLLNAALLDDLEHGSTSILLRLDAATRAGLDPDDPRASTLVGVDGCSIARLADLARAFKGVHLDMIGTYLEPGAAFQPAAALLAALWESAGISPAKVRGGFGADPLAVLARDGHLPYSLEEAMSRLADLARWTRERYEHVTSVRVGTAAYHHAGATATQDLAFSMATAVTYLRALTAAGLSVDDAARQMTFSYAVGCNTFLAIAKLRAARLLWGKVVAASGGSARAQRMEMHARPSRRVMTRRDPWVNILRNTACVFAAGVGGADAIGSVPFDAPLEAALHGGRGLGTGATELGRRLARNTQIILQEESHLHQIADLAGGSWYVERLTEDLAEKAWVIFRAIESRGGMASCITSGFVAEQIDGAWQPRVKNIQTRRDAITGVSEFALSRERPVDGLTGGPDLAALRAAASTATAAARSTKFALGPRPEAGLGAWTQSLFEAARAGATIGQLSRWHDSAFSAIDAATPAPIALHPYAEAFERLRDACDAYAAECGHRPRAFLASMGRLAEHTARTGWSTGFLEAGGFEVVRSEGYARVEDALSAFIASGATTAVICGTDAAYETIVPALAPALHKAGARTVVLAGNPGPREAAYRQAGVDRFIYVKCDVVGTLEALLHAEGIELEPDPLEALLAAQSPSPSPSPRPAATTALAATNGGAL